MGFTPYYELTTLILHIHTLSCLSNQDASQKSEAKVPRPLISWFYTVVFLKPEITFISVHPDEIEALKNEQNCKKIHF